MARTTKQAIKTVAPEAAQELPPWHGKALVRIRGPGETPVYYRSFAAIPWVATGYDTWPVGEWLSIYGGGYKNDTRQWEFFGEMIDIWEGYSEK
jgi:hypothetical protein